jgi:hypothetical protein
MNRIIVSLSLDGLSLFARLSDPPRRDAVVFAFGICLIRQRLWVEVDAWWLRFPCGRGDRLIGEGPFLGSVIVTSSINC